MNNTETLTVVTWLNQFDGRIQVSDATVQIWQDSLSVTTYDETIQAVQDHYRTNETVATPFGIRRLAHANRERAAAGTRALSARKPEPAVTYDALARHMDQPQFQEFFAAGRRDGNAGRAYRTVLRETGDMSAAQAAADVAARA